MFSSLLQPITDQVERFGWLYRINEHSGYELGSAPEHIRADRQIVLAAVASYGWALHFASPDLQQDREVVLLAVENKPSALRHAASELQNDKEVVMLAVQMDGMALEFASPNLQANKEIVWQALLPDEPLGRRAPIQSLQFASPHLLQNDKAFVLKVVSKYGTALEFMPDSMKRDKTISLTAVGAHPDAIKYVPEELKRDQDILAASGMFDEDHDDEDHKSKSLSSSSSSSRIRKIVLSTRFSLNASSTSEATKFTRFLKMHKYVETGNFKVYAPNAFDKKTCDPNWTDFYHPYRGTKDTCQFDDALKTGRPTDACCWRYSFRCQLENAKASQGFMLQIVESGTSHDDSDYWEAHEPPTLGKGQTIERDMAQQLGMKIFQVYRPRESDGQYPFKFDHVKILVAAIQDWYDGGCQDMSECVLHMPWTTADWKGGYKQFCVGTH